MRGTGRYRAGQLWLRVERHRLDRRGPVCGGTAVAGVSAFFWHGRLDGGLGDDCDAEHYCRDGACVPVGAGALDATCEEDADCQAAFRCLLSSETMRRECSPQPTMGEACSRSGDCGADAYCNAAGSCAAIPTAGQSCAPAASQTGLTCMPGSACANGVCEAGTGEGEACGVTCAPGLACESGFCRASDAAVCAFVVDAL